MFTVAYCGCPFVCSLSLVSVRQLCEVFWIVFQDYSQLTRKHRADGAGPTATCADDIRHLTGTPRAERASRKRSAEPPDPPTPSAKFNCWLSRHKQQTTCLTGNVVSADTQTVTVTVARVGIILTPNTTASPASTKRRTPITTIRSPQKICVTVQCATPSTTRKVEGVGGRVS